MLSAVDAAKAYYHRLRSEEDFDRFFIATTQIAEKYTIGKQCYQGTDAILQGLKMGLHLMTIQVQGHTIAILTLKPVIFFC